MPDPGNPLQTMAAKLLELRREDELRAISTLRGSINMLSHAVELAEPGVMSRTTELFAQWLATCSTAESAALVIHASLAMLELVRASNEGDSLLDIDELLRRHARAAAESAKKEHEDVQT